MGMMPFLVAGLAALSVMVLALGIARAGSGDTVSSRLERYASGSTEAAVEAGRQSAVTGLINRAMEGQDRAARLSTDLARADLKLKPAEFVTLWLISPILFVAAAFAVGIVFGFFQSIPGLMIAFLIGAYAPRWYLKRRAAKRLKEFDAQLPDTITLLANSLRAGSSFLQGIDLVKREAGGPMADEFDRVVREMNLGQNLESALNNLVRRVDSEDLELVVTAINIQSQVGGNLANVLDAIAFTIRERIRIKGEINTLTAMGRYSGYVLLALPAALGLILFVISPSYMGAMFEKPPQFLGLPMGLFLFAIGGVSMGMGYLMIRRIVNIKV
ncbi:MAG: type II secretion system F family protein [Candidatus Limnocylindria bacterium]